MNTNRALTIAWGHAVALLKALRGRPEEPQAKGLIKALEELKAAGPHSLPEPQRRDVSRAESHRDSTLPRFNRNEDMRGLHRNSEIIQDR